MNKLDQRRVIKMKKYRVQYWEKVSVWVLQDVVIETEEKPTKENLAELIATKPVDYYDSDYSWDTIENEEYDLTNDFEVEEV